MRRPLKGFRRAQLMLIFFFDGFLRIAARVLRRMTSVSVRRGCWTRLARWTRQRRRVLLGRAWPIGSAIAARLAQTLAGGRLRESCPGSRLGGGAGPGTGSVAGGRAQARGAAAVAGLRRRIGRRDRLPAGPSRSTTWWRPRPCLPFLLDDRRRPGAPWTAGLPYRYLARCESTNAGPQEAMVAEPPDRRSRTLVVTDDQTGGRGRLDRTWGSDAAKTLTFSVLLRPSLAPGQAHLLSLAAALAVAEMLEALPGLEGRVAVKWPNDVLVGDEKVCGILLEGSMDADRLQWAVAGIGLNVNSASVCSGARSRAGGGEGVEGRPPPVSLAGTSGRGGARGRRSWPRFSRV